MSSVRIVSHQLNLGLLGAFLALVLVVLASGTFGRQAYDFEVVARTGKPVGGASPVALGQGPSINNAGKVAFIARDRPNSTGRVVLVGRTVERNYPVESPATVGDYVQVNDLDQVIFHQGFDDGLVSYIQRLDSADGGQTIAIGSYVSWLDAPFLEVLSWMTLNNKGRGVFSAIGYRWDEYTYLATRAGGADDYCVAPPLRSFPVMYPMLSDNDRTVLRGGRTDQAPIMVFADATLNPGTAHAVATSADFNALGAAPGISDDGRVVAFMGDHKTEGAGIYVSILSRSGSTGPFKIAGASDGFTAFSLEPRVGVNFSGRGSPDEYTVAYIAYGPRGQLGLYRTTFEIADDLQPTVVDTSLVLEVGQQIAGIAGKIDNIRVYDPVNNSGQLVFWASTSTGSQAIIRAVGPVIESFDANWNVTLHELPLKETSQDLLESLAHFEPWLFSDKEDKQVHAVAADGVSLLLLQMRIPGEEEGEVTFTVENSSEGPPGPLGTIWRVDDVSLRSQANKTGDWDSEAPVGGTTVSAKTFLDEGRTYAFALYRAPRDFDNDVPVDPAWPSYRERARRITIRVKLHTSFPSVYEGVEARKDLLVVRPPVLLVHGTYDSPRGWDNFPLWSKSTNKGNDFSPADDGFPLVVFRLDYEMNHAGRLETNARLILPQIEEAIGEFRTCGAFRDLGISRVAAAQADIVTHSYAGPIVRKVSQLQFHPYPSDTIDPRLHGLSFRTNYNWGYGYIHKLITLSGTHKGSQLSAHLAEVNRWSGGAINEIAINRTCLYGTAPLQNPLRCGLAVSGAVNAALLLRPDDCEYNRIDCGAVADQYVVSEALQSLRQAIYPSHAVVGSGTYENSVPGNLCSLGFPMEQSPFALIHMLACCAFDRGVSQMAPYCEGAADPGILNMVNRGFLVGDRPRRLVNYIFNLDPDSGAGLIISMPWPWEEGEIGDAPNYDLTVRLSSMQGGLTGDAVTDVLHLDLDGSMSDAFVGQLTHLTEMGDSPVAQKLALRIGFLLRQPTASKYFARFLAVADIIDDFDRRTMEKFPEKQVEANLRVYPNALGPLPTSFEDEAKRRLDGGENGLHVIRNP